MNQCAQCGSCCKSHSVLITFRDMQEILRNYPEIEPLKAFLLYEVNANYIDEYKLENYPIIHVDNSEGNQTVSGYLALRFENDTSGILSCLFFNKEQKKCNIHLHKPWICRVYPHTFDDDHTIIFHKGRCPKPWMYSKDEVPQISAFIRQVYQSYDDYRMQAYIWNSSTPPRTFEKFLQFVLNLI